MNEAIVFTIPNKMKYLDLAVKLVSEVAARRGFEGSALNQIEVGVEEAVSNVMKHAFDLEENPSFDIRCVMEPDGLRVILRETGTPFDPAHIPSFEPDRLGETLSTEGMGTYLMKTVLDEVEHVNLGPLGKETRLFKRLEGVVLPASAPVEPAATEAEVIKEKLRFHVRRMQPDEAIHVSRCAYKSHGYSFFDDHIYYPEKLRELNETDQMISAVAVTEAGTFMGHAALLYQNPEDRIAELTFVFVNVEYRGQGALHELNTFLLEAPKKKPLEGIYAYAVANHLFTQKGLNRSGLKDCGLLLATSPASWKFKGIPGDPNQRISVVLGFMYVGTPEKRTLYLPDHHRPMIVDLYQNIGMTHNFLQPPPGLAPARDTATEFDLNLNASEQCGEIYVRRLGSDAVPVIRRQLRRLCLDGYAAINLFLDMADPLSAVLCAGFESLGFFFAGILPRSLVGEALMLQYLNNVDLDYGKICTYTPQAQSLLAYIQAHDPNAGI